MPSYCQMEHSYQNGTLIKMEHSYYQNGTLVKMEPSSKWNTHQNGTLIKMEHSYYQKETLIKMEHSYYQNGTLILKREYSSKWKHSYHQKAVKAPWRWLRSTFGCIFVFLLWCWLGSRDPSSNTLHLWLLLAWLLVDLGGRPILPYFAFHVSLLILYPPVLVSGRIDTSETIGTLISKRNLLLWKKNVYDK